MINFKEKCIAFITACVLSTSLFANQPTVNLQQINKDKKEFIQEMVLKHHFNRDHLNHLFNTLHPNEKILDSMNAPFEKKPWTFYRGFFLTRERINLGAIYLKKHHRSLMKMQKKYGIPASIITAIIGVETEYGTHLGKYPVLSTLYTLGFYYPTREKFFRKELAQYLILARDNHLHEKTIKGSYAGALGIPQFMPSSYLHFGVSYKKNHAVNLFNQDDAIASVANYFHKNGWQPNQPITELLKSKHQRIDNDAKRISLPLEDGTEYWAIYRNFNVIMSYNHNVVYAMAVYQLSQAIEKQYALNRKHPTL